MGLSKFNPVIVKKLTVRGSQKHPSTIKNFLPGEQSIYTREISQDIENVHPTFNTFSLFYQSKNFLHDGGHGKISHNLQIFQDQPQGVLHMSIHHHND